MLKNTQQPSDQSTPKYWWLLNESDRAGYSYMRSLITNNPESNQRNKRVSTFLEMIEMIRRYAVRGDSGDANRCLVCGILWLPGAIAINTHQLGFLMDKCKSSINGCFQILGYQEKISRKSASDLVANTLSMIHDNRSELRKWTVRCMNDCLLELSSQSEATELKPKQEHKHSSKQSLNLNNQTNAQSFIQQASIPTQEFVTNQIHIPTQEFVTNQIPIPTQEFVTNQLPIPMNSQPLIDSGAFQLMPQSITKVEDQIQLQVHDREQTFDNYEFPIPLKKGITQKNTENDYPPAIDSLGDSGNFEFSKEDAIINSLLNEFHDNSSDIWNIECMPNDYFF